MSSVTAVLLVGALLPLAGCAAVSGAIDGGDAPVVVAAAPTDRTAATDERPAPPSSDPAKPAPTSTSAATSTSTVVPTTTVAGASIPGPTIDPGDADPDGSNACVVTVEPDDTLRAIAARYDDESIDLASIVAENALTTTDVEPGMVLDICPGNGLDDVTGVERVDEVEEVEAGVEAQQAHLNALFAGYGIDELTVDGISGQVTGQLLCAARLALGLPVSTDDMEPGGLEEQLLFATDRLPIPSTSALQSERWILIDRTCQVMFVGQGATQLQFVFPTSTGQAAYPTRDQNLTPAYRYDPAANNNGWHNSTIYPAAQDNALNGNMYRPLYFDGGQAIHGANNVPRSPASHGCARLRLRDQDQLLDWLGLGGLRSPINDTSRISVTVNVQGTWRG